MSAKSEARCLKCTCQVTVFSFFFFFIICSRWLAYMQPSTSPHNEAVMLHLSGSPFSQSSLLQCCSLPATSCDVWPGSAYHSYYSKSQVCQQWHEWFRLFIHVIGISSFFFFSFFLALYTNVGSRMEGCCDGASDLWPVVCLYRPSGLHGVCQRGSSDMLP